MGTIILSILPFVLIALVVIVLFCTGYVKAPPDVAYVISGLHKKPRILVGKAGLKIPFFERLDKLYLGAIQIDVKTGSSVPTAEYINVRVDSTVSVKVSEKPELMTLAAQNFLNVDREEIASKINDLLEGNIREIVGQMNLTDMVSDRKLFSEKVQENAVPDLARYGLELITFNVQNFSDDNDVITNLGIDNVEQIRKKAAIAKSDAQREIAIAEAANAKDANDARVKAAEDMAIRNNDLAIKQSQLKQEADTRQAQADAAASIEAENQRKLRDVAATEANIAKAEREADLKQKQIQLKEYELDALVRKQADADKYAAEQQAAANLIKRQKEAEAKAYEMEQEARAMKARAEAEKYAAEQKAAGIAAVGEAEASAIEKKAEAQKKMGEASVLEMYLKALPEVVKNAAEPLNNVDKITVYGEGGNTKLVSDVMQTADKIMNSLSEATGIDLKEVLGNYLKK